MPRDRPATCVRAPNSTPARLSRGSRHEALVERLSRPEGSRVHTKTFARSHGHSNKRNLHVVHTWYSGQLIVVFVSRAPRKKGLECRRHLRMLQ